MYHEYPYIISRTGLDDFVGTIAGEEQGSLLKPTLGCPSVILCREIFDLNIAFMKLKILNL